MKREGLTKIKEDPKRQNRRYYLHRKVKKGFNLDVPKRTIYIAAAAYDMIDVKMARIFAELKSYGYVFQTFFE